MQEKYAKMIENIFTFNCIFYLMKSIPCSAVGCIQRVERIERIKRIG